MVKTFWAVPAVSGFRGEDGSTGCKARTGALSCVWIETGNPKQRLARVWIDREMRLMGGDADNAESSKRITHI